MTEFVVGTEKIDATGFSSAQISIFQQGTSTIVRLASGETLVLQNVQASSLTFASFIGLTDEASAKVAGGKLPGHVDPIRPELVVPHDPGHAHPFFRDLDGQVHHTGFGGLPSPDLPMFQPPPEDWVF